MGEGDSRRLRAPVVFWASAALANREETQHRGRRIQGESRSRACCSMGTKSEIAMSVACAVFTSSSCRMRPRLPRCSLSGCGGENHYVAPPPPVVTVMTPRAEAGHALSRGDRQHRRGQHRQSGRARAGLRAGDQVSGRRVREEGHVALHHRAASPTSSSSNRRRPPRPRAKAAVIYAEAEFKRQDELVAKQVSTQALYDKWLSQRDVDRANVQQAQANTADGRDQLRLHRREGAVRRHRHRAPGVDRRHGRRHHAHAARHHRPARSDLRQLQSRPSATCWTCARRSGGAA